MRKVSVYAIYAICAVSILGCSSSAPAPNSIRSLGKSVVMAPGESCVSTVECQAPILEVESGTAIETNYYAACPVSATIGTLGFELLAVEDYWAILPLYGVGDHVLTIYITGESHQAVLRFK